MKCVIFDFDGTLVDTKGCIVESMNYAFAKLGLPEVAAQEIQNTIGLPLRNSLMVLGNITSEETVQQAVDYYGEHFDEIYLQRVKLFDHVKEVLEQLHKAEIPMAIATSRRRDSLEKIMKALGIDGYFVATASDDDVEDKKPAPEMVHKLLKELSVDAADTLVVGDTIYDIEMGNSAGCVTCAVVHGNHTDEMLRRAMANHVVADIIGVLPLMGLPIEQ